MAVAEMSRLSARRVRRCVVDRRSMNPELRAQIRSRIVRHANNPLIVSDW
jgi:hypothetical protein